MKSFLTFQKFLADLDYRQQALKDKKLALIHQRTQLETQLANALADGSDYAEAHGQIEALDRELAIIEKGIGYFLNNPVPKTPKLLEVCEAVIKEAQTIVDDISVAYTEQAKKTIDARNAFLSEVRELGRISRLGSDVSSKAARAMAHMPQPHTFIGIKDSDKFSECAAIDLPSIRAAYERPGQ